jgi:hypothetical protein
LGGDYRPDQAARQDDQKEESSVIHSLFIPHKAFDTKIPGAILPQYPVSIRKFFENSSAFNANGQPDQFQKPQTEKSSTRSCPEYLRMMCHRRRFFRRAGKIFPPSLDCRNKIPGIIVEVLPYTSCHH